MKNDKPIIINLYGGPGAGKSTTAAGVFCLLKLHNTEVELVTEFAKDLVWEERYKTFGNQYYIFGKQHHRMWRLKDKVDIVITDSPLMLSALHGRRNGTVSDAFVKNVVEAVNNSNNFNVLLERTKKYNPNGRNETEDQAREVDKLVIGILKEHDMEWIKVLGNFKGINKITKLILKNFGKKLKFKMAEV